MNKKVADGRSDLDLASLEESLARARKNLLFVGEKKMFLFNHLLFHFEAWRMKCFRRGFYGTNQFGIPGTKRKLDSRDAVNSGSLHTIHLLLLMHALIERNKLGPNCNRKKNIFMKTHPPSFQSKYSLRE